MSPKAPFSQAPFALAEKYKQCSDGINSEPLQILQKIYYVMTGEKAPKGIKKKDMLEKILEVLTPEQRQLIEVPIETPPKSPTIPTAIPQQEEEDDSDTLIEFYESDVSNSELRTQELYKKLRDIALDDKDWEKTREDVDLFLLAWVDFERRSYVLTTMKKNMSIYKSRITQMVASEESDSKRIAIQDVVERFLKGYRRCLRQDLIDIKRTYAKGVADNNKKLRPIEAQPLINWAKRTLEQAKAMLDQLPHPDIEVNPKAVSVAIAIATGRRMVEIHNCGRLIKVADYKMNFSGQAKIRGRETTEINYDIPVLVESYLVEAGLILLEKKNLRGDHIDLKKMNSISKQISRFINEYWEPDFRSLNIDYKQLRALYTAICYKMFYDDSQTINMFFRELLGHSENDNVTSNSYQLFRVIDIE